MPRKATARKLQPAEAQLLKLPAIEIKQGKKTRIYSFGVDGKRIPEFAAISRIRRDDDGKVDGYQRPEVLSHIAQIRTYIESKEPMIPNALVIAFNEEVRFEPSPDYVGPAHFTPGTLLIPIDPDRPPEARPGWVVDGQQRLAAIRDAGVQSFPVCVTAFIAASDKQQREQFILVNSTKPLPKGLIYELLPQTEAKLPPLLQRRRFPAYLLDRLNYDSDSPLRSRISTPTTEKGVIKDNSILKMLENSLSDGALYPYRDTRSGTGDIQKMLQLLKNYWSAVAEVFPGAWLLPPRRSRLTHGAGIVSMGFIMDAIADRHSTNGLPSAAVFVEDLRRLEPVCKWNNGYWDFGPGDQRKWNEVQNTARDVSVLTNYLLVCYRAAIRAH